MVLEQVQALLDNVELDQPTMLGIVGFCAGHLVKLQAIDVADVPEPVLNEPKILSLDGRFDGAAVDSESSRMMLMRVAREKGDAGDIDNEWGIVLIVIIRELKDARMLI